MKNFNLKKLYNCNHILSMIIVSCILLISFTLVGFAPFGENSILRVDLYHQYAPFHEELRHKILSFDSLFYSWEGGLGKDFLSQMAYYTFSPLSLLILFFPSTVLPDAILLFVFLKIVACSGIFSYFLSNKFKQNDFKVVIFAVMYSFIAYITSFYWNIMWLDSIALFPLVAMGIDTLIKNKNPKKYLIFLCISIFVNFYIAFLVCVFATLYFLVSVFSTYSLKNDLKIILNRFFHFFTSSLIGGCLTMVLAIPTAIAIGKTATSDTSFPNFEVYQNIYQIFTNHFSGARPIILARNEDLPNIYSGVLTILLLPTYFANKKIKLKEKLLMGLLIIFMILCSVLKPLDYLIHGAHFPANLPHRYTFIYSFIILTLAFKSLIYIEDLNLKVLKIFSVVYILIIFISEFVFVGNVSDIDRVLSNADIFINIILIVLYNFILTYYKAHEKIKDELFLYPPKILKIIPAFFSCLIPITFLIILLLKNKVYSETSFSLSLTIKNIYNIFSFKIFFIILLIIILSVLCFILLKKALEQKNIYKNLSLLMLLFIVCIEATTNSFNGFTYNGGTIKQDYTKYIKDTKQMLDYIKATDNDENKFFRQEFRRFTTINDASLYHYNGFSQFSSLAYGNTSRLIELLGIAATSNSYRYYDPTPLINSIFNIKYIMNKEETIDLPDYEFLKQFNSVYLYKNPTYLSLGFMVDKNILNWKLDENNPFINQNEFVKHTTNISENLTNNVKLEYVNFENIKASKNKNVEGKYSYSLIDKNSLDLIPKVFSKVVAPKDGRMFLYVDSPNSSRFKYSINDATQDRELSTGRSLIDLGYLEKNTEIFIEFSLTRKGEHEKTFRPNGDFKLFASTFENNIFEKAYNILSSNMLVVKNYSSSKIEGEINANKDGILFTSIPFDKSFKVFVNDKLVDTLQIANDGLLAINLPKGFHNIKFVYKTSGLYLGTFISCISLILLFIYFKYLKNNENNKK